MRRVHSPAGRAAAGLIAVTAEADLPSTGTLALPSFEVRIAAPDLGPYLAGNTGIPGFTRLTSPNPGPHALILALTHGNEISGAIIVERLLRAAFRPARGTLTVGFVNLAAFSRFDPRLPTLSRFVDEDMNRVWDPAMLDGPRRSCELDRARDIRPAIEAADAVLDLHSMLWPADPLILCGPSEGGLHLARRIGTAALIVSDRGHINGPRIIDQARFTGPAATAAAVLLESGQHWDEAAVTVAHRGVASFLRHLRMAGEDVALPLPLPHPVQRHAMVTEAVVAATSHFCFTDAFRGGDVIAERGCLIAMDGEVEIRTPHDDCLLVMPSLRPIRGHTAVRLARFMP
ncbi:MAG: peptidase M14 [Acetobacteraceae bacterium]|nr:peptidase M14 [Acetobacteraceae bacterium]